eukprot:TRINITY_DN9650_c0_g1_i2.p1 TRINITY_DN9650_c0_g1~~TRINITY_DN9650_c0_g1_i2.p1  ORF type:complete len:945 (+),score=307.73 TRINITY_DN9650_c0_g1_i2:273-2837(+)
MRDVASRERHRAHELRMRKHVRPSVGYNVITGVEHQYDAVVGEEERIGNSWSGSRASYRSGTSSSLAKRRTVNGNSKPPSSNRNRRGGNGSQASLRRRSVDPKNVLSLSSKNGKNDKKGGRPMTSSSLASNGRPRTSTPRFTPVSDNMVQHAQSMAVQSALANPFAKKQSLDYLNTSRPSTSNRPSSSFGRPMSRSSLSSRDSRFSRSGSRSGSRLGSRLGSRASSCASSRAASRSGSRSGSRMGSRGSQHDPQIMTIEQEEPEHEKTEEELHHERELRMRKHVRPSVKYNVVTGVEMQYDAVVGEEEHEGEEGGKQQQKLDERTEEMVHAVKGNYEAAKFNAKITGWHATTKPFAQANISFYKTSNDLYGKEQDYTQHLKPEERRSQLKKPVKQEELWTPGDHKPNEMFMSTYQHEMLALNGPVNSNTDYSSDEDSDEEPEEVKQVNKMVKDAANDELWQNKDTVAGRTYQPWTAMEGLKKLDLNRTNRGLNAHNDTAAIFQSKAAKKNTDDHFVTLYAGSFNNSNQNEVTDEQLKASKKSQDLHRFQQGDADQVADMYAKGLLKDELMPNVVSWLKHATPDEKKQFYRLFGKIHDQEGETTYRSGAAWKVKPQRNAARAFGTDYYASTVGVGMSIEGQEQLDRSLAEGAANTKRVTIQRPASSSSTSSSKKKPAKFNPRPEAARAKAADYYGSNVSIGMSMETHQPVQEEGMHLTHQKPTQEYVYRNTTYGKSFAFYDAKTMASTHREPLHRAHQSTYKTPFGTLGGDESNKDVEKEWNQPTYRRGFVAPTRDQQNWAVQKKMGNLYHVPSASIGRVMGGEGAWKEIEARAHAAVEKQKARQERQKQGGGGI